MSGRVNISKMVTNIYKKEKKQIKYNKEFFTQANENIDYNKILRFNPVFSTLTPIYDKERIDNLKKVKNKFLNEKKKSNLNLEFLNKGPVSAIINSKRISADSNSLVFNKIDPVRQVDSEITYSHYDTSIYTYNRRLIEKTARKIEKQPLGKIINFYRKLIFRE
jgi:hypothetical protein